jgi:allantoate deiminase
VDHARHGAAFGAAIEPRLRDLSRISDDAHGLTRLYLSPAHGRALEQIETWMRAAGMAVRRSALGDAVGRYEAATPDAQTLLLGSHLDTVRNAGRFDGALGIVTALAMVDRLHVERRRLPFAIEVVAFGDEEGSRFLTTLTGSRALAGRFDPAVLKERDNHGVTRGEALAAFGCDASAVAAEARDPRGMLGYLEVHIEQGPVLEARGLPVGIVTGIAGATRGSVTVTGVGGHAGTMPMGLRRDALCGAAEMILAIEARGRAGPDLVATVGRLDVLAGATNTVPGAVTFTWDIRSPSDLVRRAAVADIRAAIGHIATARGLTADVTIGHEANAAEADARLVSILETAVRDAAIEPLRLASGAGHDAMAFAGHIPFAMLFVRCAGGLSHRPDEFASVADIGAAADVLWRAIERLAAQRP